MSCALCPEYYFCELKKNVLDKNAIFIARGVMLACVPSMERIGNNYVVSHSNVYLRV